MSKGLLFAAVLVGCACVVAAQIAIPHRRFGFPKGSNDAPVEIEMFIDLLCSDSKASWPTMKAVQEYYGDAKLKLIVNLSPLNVYRNSFNVDLGTFVVAKYANTSVTYNWIDAAFENQNVFWNTPTASMTGNQVDTMIGSLAESNGLVDVATMLKGLADSSLRDALTDMAYYSTTRGVVNHPFFLVNGVVVSGEPSWQVSDWTSVLDPLFAPDFRREIPTKLGDCPSGEVSCQYLPGKYQCCLPGEMCIPNVGCRC